MQKQQKETHTDSEQNTAKYKMGNLARFLTTKCR